MRFFLIFLPLFLFASDATVEQLFNVKTTKVRQITKSQTKKFYGVITIDERDVVDITPRFSGYIEKLYANTKYQKVQKGEVLAKVYSPEVYKTKQEYQNSLRYGGNSNISQALKTKLQLLEIDISKIKKNPKPFIMIRAKSDGYIIKSLAVEGGSFSSKKPLFTIAKLSNMRMEAKIPQKNIKDIKNFSSFEVQVPSQNKTYKATNPYLYPLIDKKSALATLRVDVNSNGNLLDGQYANLIAKKVKQTYLVIPKTAVIRKNGVWYAFKKGEYEGEWEPTVVKLKSLDSKNYIVLSGLKKDEEIANKAMFLLDSDAQINGMFP